MYTVHIIMFINRSITKHPHTCQAETWNAENVSIVYLIHGDTEEVSYTFRTTEGPHFAKPGASSSSNPDFQIPNNRKTRLSFGTHLEYCFFPCFPLKPRIFHEIFHHVMFTIAPPVAKFLKEMVLALRVCFLRRRAPL